MGQQTEKTFIGLDGRPRRQGDTERHVGMNRCYVKPCTATVFSVSHYQGNWCNIPAHEDPEGLTTMQNADAINDQWDDEPDSIWDSPDDLYYDGANRRQDAPPDPEEDGDQTGGCGCFGTQSS